MQIAGTPPAAVPAGAAGPSTSPATSTDAPSSSASPAGANAQPSVTVTLSDAASAALAATNTATDKSAAAPSSNPDVFAGASSIVQQVQYFASMLVDGSGASNADKATATANLYQLRFESGGDGTRPSEDDWFTQSTQAQRDVVNGEIEGSSFFKQSISAAAQFNSVGIASARAGNPSGTPSESARFDQLSSDQQILVWAGGASQYGSLDAFKSALAGYASANTAAPFFRSARATSAVV